MRASPAALVALGLLLTTGAAAQTAPTGCEARCNQQASDCIRVCTGDPKDAQQPEQRRKLTQCLGSCEAKTKACKEACGKRPDAAK